ncbi:unnamed protein product [Lactuca virosa]|uniref:Reverse transcriptase zinc-binding domain-containing protein n=1 Tax=Lactuca virosa TaxID=75947 RepID=A0AAU9NZV5_9ASTR|nr:unnamed protein product [Lactuca virosa]
MFWLDAWKGDGILKDRYPQLYDLDTDKRCTVMQKINGNSILWRSCPLARGLESDLGSLYNDISHTRLTSGVDQLHCHLMADGTYTVECLRNMIDHNPLPLSCPLVRWCKEAPIKVICFIWRAAQGHIPSAMSLAHRGVSLSETMCGSCVGVDESVYHMLVSCHFAQHIRNIIFKWCGVGPTQINTVH